MKFSSIYPLYIAKVEKKNRTKSEVDEVICWLTGYSKEQFVEQLEREVSFEGFFAQAPLINPKAKLITGMICGYRIEEIEYELMRNIRYLDKLVDEIAKGRPMEKILQKWFYIIYQLFNY